jgi:putative ABC transport system substrate-binding protein
MRRREFLAAIAGALACTPQSRAAPRPDPVIGYLYAGSLEGFPDDAKNGYWRALAEFGYERGRNVSIEFRQAHNDLSRLPALALDLVRRQVSVIIVLGSMEALDAARSATSTIPIIFSNAASDPVRAGIVASLSRPGGNVTGLGDFGSMLSAKRIELIKLLVPEVSRVGLLMTPVTPRNRAELTYAEQGARALSLDAIVGIADNQQEIDAAFAMFAEKRIDAVCAIPTSLFFDRRAQVVALAARHRLPAVYSHNQFVESGGLMSYGISVAERAYQLGIYTALILNGANPAELPVRRLSRFELVINMSAASALGVTVPAGLLAITDRVIE